MKTGHVEDRLSPRQEKYTLRAITVDVFYMTVLIYIMMASWSDGMDNNQTRIQQDEYLTKSNTKIMQKPRQEIQ